MITREEFDKLPTEEDEAAYKAYMSSIKQQLQEDKEDKERVIE